MKQLVSKLHTRLASYVYVYTHLARSTSELYRTSGHSGRSRTSPHNTTHLPRRTNPDVRNFHGDASVPSGPSVACPVLVATRRSISIQLVPLTICRHGDSEIRFQSIVRGHGHLESNSFSFRLATVTTTTQQQRSWPVELAGCSPARASRCGAQTWTGGAHRFTRFHALPHIDAPTAESRCTYVQTRPYTNPVDRRLSFSCCLRSILLWRLACHSGRENPTTMLLYLYTRYISGRQTSTSHDTTTQ